METNSTQDFFCRRGHIRLALDLLRDCLQVIMKDPELKTQEAREEMAWLRGESAGSSIDVATVFDSLRLSGWSRRFASMAEQDPKMMAERLRDLNLAIDRYFDNDDYTYRTDLRLEPIQANGGGQAQLSLLDDPASPGGFDELEPAMESYAERARAC